MLIIFTLFINKIVVDSERLSMKVTSARRRLHIHVRINRRFLAVSRDLVKRTRDYEAKRSRWIIKTARADTCAVRKHEDRIRRARSGSREIVK